VRWCQYLFLSDNEGLPENIRKINFLDLFLIALGGIKGINEKMVLIDKSQKEKKHLTIMALGDTLDIHETIEGREKNYNPIAKIDMSVLKDMKTQSISIEDLVSRCGIEEIDINAPEYHNFIAFAPDEQFEKITIKKKEALITPESKLPICPLSQIAARDYRYVIVSEENAFRFVVQKMQGKYYKLTPKTMSKILFMDMPML
jgi:hypothetical protein